MNTHHSRKRSLFLVTLIAAFVFAACGTASPSEHKVSIGIINYSASLDPVITGLKANLADAGYIEGKNIEYLYDGLVAAEATALDNEIQKLASKNPDFYMAIGSPPAVRLQPVLEKTGKYAIFAPVTNPIGFGLVKDLRKPGGRLTGVDVGGPVVTKTLEWFLRVASTVKRVHVFYLHDETLVQPNLPFLQIGADKLKVELVLHAVSSEKDIPAIVATFDPVTDGIFLPLSQLMFAANGLDFVDAAVKQGIPMGSSVAAVTKGMLTTAGVDYVQIGKQAGNLAQQLIHGADAGTVSVVPVQFTLVLNLATANAEGITVPDDLLKQADKVIHTDPTPVVTPAATASN